jgi:anti-sigma-K factor RskA
VDIKAYIESGIIESYVMRLTSVEETAEVESMMAEYPEIAEAVNDFEIRLEQQLMNKAVTPPPHIKEQLTAVLTVEFNNDAGNRTVKEHAAKIGPAYFSKPLWKYITAASIVLLLGSGWLNIHYYNKYTKVQSDYNTLLATQSGLIANADANQARLRDMEDLMKIMLDPNIKQVAMLPPDKSNTLLATAYWNSSTKELYLAQNKMPAAPAGKQYQLWALVNGRPVNAGVINDCGQLLCKMTNIVKADGFAITLEKSGGSPTPDLTQLKVIGNIPI